MDIFSMLNMIGGLALFLYGMSSMGDGLSKMAGGKLEKVLEKLTSKKIYAVLLGMGVTAVIQSSSATTVMVVGFVNSGIMQLGQAVGIIMGANIGTTVTSWMLSLTGIQGETIWLKLLKPSSFSPVLAAVGIVMLMMCKEGSRKRDIGSVLVGFAILMFGMETMSGAVSGLSENPAFVRTLTLFSNPILGMLVGAGVTAVIQSSSASVGILQAICLTGAVDYSIAIPIIMGQNIGTCITSIISSIGASKNAKRASMIHLYFNLIGTIIFMIAFYGIGIFIDFHFLEAAANPAGIAVVHSLFNIGAVIILYPFSDYLVKLAKATIKDSANDGEEIKEGFIAIDDRFLEQPAFAMEICRQKTYEMAGKTLESISLALEALENPNREKIKEVYKAEDIVDMYDGVLGAYLVKLSGKNLSKKDSQSLTQMLHGISDFERISDHAVNIADTAKEIYEKKIQFAEDATEEIKTICSAVRDIATKTKTVYVNMDYEEAIHIEPLEQVIDHITRKIKKNHITRLQEGNSSMEKGIILENILMNLERVSDHCSNIAVEMLAINSEMYDTHDYFGEMTAEERSAFNKEYEELKKKYYIQRVSATM